MVIDVYFHLKMHFLGVPGLDNSRMCLFWIEYELRMMETVVTTGGIRRANL